MRWIKVLLVLLIISAIGYVLSMYYFFDDKKTFSVDREINYPVDKVFSQFNDLQNFTNWNHYFYSDKDFNFRYFYPYSGEGSSMSFINAKDKNKKGEIFIKKSEQNKSIKYDFFQGLEKSQYKINVDFLPKGNSTKIVWSIDTPIMPLLTRFRIEYIDDDIIGNIDLGLKKLEDILSKKVNRESVISKLKYDSVIVSEQEDRLFIGVNEKISNKKLSLIKNIESSHNKVINFVSKDLSKKEDEYGEPILITSINGKDISYFYGVLLPKKENISDNSFVFREVKKSKYYSIYYRGEYNNIKKTLAKLQDKIKKDGMMPIGQVEELFLEAPSQGKPVILKISIPVAKNIISDDN